MVRALTGANHFFYGIFKVQEQAFKSRLLLVGWDAADWKFINPLLDSGRMPNLSHLVDHGVIGNLASLKPCLSPILWTSIATGKTADQHGILGFVEPLPGGMGVKLYSSDSRRTKAIWNILDQVGLPSIVVNWYASHPAESIKGCVVSNRFFDAPPEDAVHGWKVVPGSVSDGSLAMDLASWRFHPRELTASDVARFIPDIGKVDIGQDNRPNTLVRELAKTISVHAVSTHLMQSMEWSFTAILYEGIDTLGHHFMPFHPPKLPLVSDSDHELYRDVMTQVYLFHDEMLGRLMELAGDETTIMLVSDHGFHCDHQRPVHLSSEAPEDVVAAAWHRHFGVIAMKGPGIRRDERVYGATLLDVTPTALQVMDLPIGKDMNGKPLLQVFERVPETVPAIDSWEDPAKSRSSHNLETVDDLSRDAVQQLIDLGYLPSSAMDEAHAAQIAADEAQFNLAIVYASIGKHADARRELSSLCGRVTDHPRYLLALAKTLANLKAHDDCLNLVLKLESMGQTSLDLSLLAVAELFNAGRIEEATKRLQEAHQRFPPHPTLHFLTGNIMLQRSQWGEALQEFEKAIALNDEDAQAHFHASLAANRLAKHEPAAEFALRAISLMFYFPQAHFQLGLAFQGLGDVARAQRSFELAVTQAPRFLEAHQKLADLYKEQNNTLLWVKHQNLAQGGVDF